MNVIPARSLTTCFSDLYWFDHLGGLFWSLPSCIVFLILTRSLVAVIQVKLYVSPATYYKLEGVGHSKVI